MAHTTPAPAPSWHTRLFLLGLLHTLGADGRAAATTIVSAAGAATAASTERLHVGR